MPYMILAAALFVHELVYFADWGCRYFYERAFSPVYGLRLPPAGRLGLHLALLLGSLLLLSPAARGIGSGLCFLALLLMILSYPQRVPNHLVVAFVLAGLSFISFMLPSSIGAEVIEFGFPLILGLTYMFAAFHKLNRDYFCRQKSCGLGLLSHYMLQRWGLAVGSDARIIYFGVTVGVLMAEFAVFPLLFVGPLAPAGVVLVCLLSVSFGILGHAHFSLVALSGVAAMVEIPVATIATSMGAIVGIVALGFLVCFLGNTTGYRHPLAMRLSYFVLGSACGLVMMGSSTSGLRYPGNAVAWVAVGIFAVFLAINCLSPYFGLKLDHSLAMFSNLRPDVSSHFVVRWKCRRYVPRYFSVVSVETNEESEGLKSDVRSLFVRSASYKYSFYYLSESARTLAARWDPGLVVVARGIEDGTLAKFSASDPSPRRWFENTALHPVALPRVGPYCS